jgi:hypothetical protein
MSVVATTNNITSLKHLVKTDVTASIEEVNKTIKVRKIRLLFLCLIFFCGCAKATVEPKVIHFSCMFKEDHEVFRSVYEAMNAILPSMGFQFKMSYYPRKRAFSEFNNNHVDGVCASHPSTLTLLPNSVFTRTPLTYSRIVLYGRANQDEFTGLKEADKLIYVRGNPEVLKFINDEHLGISYSTTTIDQSLKMIVAGRGDYFVEFDLSAESAIKKLKFEDQLKAIPVGYLMPIYMVFNSRYQNHLYKIDKKIKTYMKDTYGREELIPY